MSSEKNEIPFPPGFPRPLAKILPTGSIDYPVFMHDHQGKAGERTFPLKRCSLRKRAPPNFFVPIHSRPSLQRHRQGLRRGRGRPRKQSSDESPGCPASQPLRRGPGRPRKQRSDVTEAPAVSPPPASPLGSTGYSPLQVSAATNAPEAVAPTPLGFRPLELPSDEEETKLNIKPSRLMHPPKTNYTPQQILDEESKKVILKVESLLVQKLLTSANEVDYVVHLANTTFRYLKGLGVDYGSFYRDVTEYITHRCNLQDAEREETMSSLSALQKNYEHAVLTANDVEEDFGRTQGEWEKAKEKKETLKKQIEDLKTEVAHIEHEEERRKHDEIKYKEAKEVEKAKMQELGTQLEAAQAKQREIELRKNAALQGILSTTRRLQSTFLGDLD